MGPTSRPEHHLNLNYIPQLTPSGPRSGSSTGANSPVEPPSAGSGRFPIGTGSSMNSVGNATAGARKGAGSPSHEYSSRLYSKRAREIQAQEGLGPSVWGPPTSGNSTPLRETIPESPNGDSFPDFAPPAAEPAPSQSSGRRTRAGTLPSRFSPSMASNGMSSQPSLAPKTARPTPSTSPFRPGSLTPVETSFGSNNSAAAKSALLSRLRAGSMPQRSNLISPGTSNPFGSSIFSTNWSSGRDRTNTLTSIRSSDGPSSPAHSSFSRDSLADTDVKTLDYLGLVDTPQPPRAQLAMSDVEMLLQQQRDATLQPQAIADLAALTKNANRFRSYSVNAKEKYADDEDDQAAQMGYAGNYSGSVTPSDPNATAYAIHEAVRQHNLEVQAFANLASASRPRARTAGVLDSPSTRLMRSYLPTPSRLDTSMTAGDMSLNEDAEYSGLAEAVRGMHLNGQASNENLGEENTLEGPTRALWLGNIPSSTTVSSLNVIFATYGAIESTRVLTHKNCGFVNFENVESAIRAKSQLNGKEIFPGAGPVRIGYAKVPSAAPTPGNNGLFPSPTPDPTMKDATGAGAYDGSGQANGSAAESGSAPLKTPQLHDIRNEIAQIVLELGANEEEQMGILQNVDSAIQHDEYAAEIPPIPEPSHNRVHDAPRLREIRKRIDNNSCSQAEIEDTALAMLPEIAELSSDYLGNTVVQKLFEFCSETVKAAMLGEIAPHLAEIGVHKNGTWAAQKIIDVARTPELMTMVVDALRNYSKALFLDQFGNYVMQGCLRYGYPLNNFIFEVMISRLWELAQGRFGARAMRACLESHYATKDQQRMVAAAIALHSVQLATNANGALLLTWFLDTCTFPHRRTVLAPRLVPHLVPLCTHKVAYLTVLKLINQRNEPEARDTILQALFFSSNDKVLEDILSDASCGATLIFKVLTTPFFDEKIRPDVMANVRNVLLRIKAQPAQGYKRLMDEVGLSTRTGGPGAHTRDAPDGPRPGSKHAHAGLHNGPMPHPQSGLDSPLSRPFFGGGVPQSPYDLQRTGSMDSTTFEHQFPGQFPVSAPGMNTLTSPVYGGQPNMPMGVNGTMPAPGMPMPNPQQAQLQYQQAMLAAQRQNQFFQPQLNQVTSPVMNTGGFDFSRNAVAGSPISGPAMGSPMMAQANYAQQGFGGMGGMNPMSPMMGVGNGMGGYGYPNPNMYVQQQGVGGGRRGRR